jgi:enoyl-CoA hydratase/carnithine racemase
LTEGVAVGTRRWWSLEHGPDGVAVATFRRPPRNLMSMAAMTELEQLLAEVAEDDAVAVLVLTGGVPGFFVAHADVEDLARLGAGQPVEGDPGSWSRAFALLESMPQPVVAAVGGQAWGGGSELCWACTARVASAAATFGQPEVLVGIIPGAGGTQRLPRLIGAGRAAELILSGRIVGADEALRLGMVEAVLPEEGFLDAAVAWAARFAAPPRPAVQAAKRAIVEGLRLPLTEGLRREAELFLACQTRPDTLAIQGDVVRRYAEAPDDARITLEPER